jgi:hypothetical protein
MVVDALPVPDERDRITTVHGWRGSFSRCGRTWRQRSQSSDGSLLVHDPGIVMLFTTTRAIAAGHRSERMA